MALRVKKGLPDFYEFQNATKVISGTGAVDHIAGELIGLGVKRPMVLSDAMLKELGILSVVTEALEEGMMEIGEIYTDIPADSSTDVVNEIAACYREKQCDGLVAVGGGSVLDTAKGVRLLLSQDVTDLMDLMGCENLVKGNYIPYIAVPTTAGTGSESTLVAVIKHVEKQVKMEFISYFLQPDAAVLDVRMTQTLPPVITASTGMDALCHAIEAYTCLQKNPLSDAYAYAAIRMISENIEKACTNGKDKNARMSMANGAMMAGTAFSNSMVGIVHAIGHALGGECNVPHAYAMGILLPWCMGYNYKNTKDLYAELLLPLAGADTYAMTKEEERGKEAVRYVRKLLVRLHKITGVPIRLRDCGVRKEDFEKVAQKAVNDGAMIVNPKKASVKDVIRILEKAY